MKTGICFFTSIISLLIFSCSGKDNIELISTNLNNSKVYNLDYSNAYSDGFIVPTINQDSEEYFSLKFKVNSFNNDILYYKIYYQNETYKFNETNENGEYNALSAENFYGSWDNINIEFDSVKIENKENILIETKFRISGNPRNEQRYNGTNSHDSDISEADIMKKMESIKNDINWYNSVKRKAKENKISEEEQLRRDAKWTLRDKQNNKWQRNPRVGTYSLLIIVTNKEGLSKIPKNIKNISKSENDLFINPYYYFLNSDGNSNSNISHLLITDFVTVKANVPLKNGIHINYSSDKFESKEFLNDYVNDNEKLYKKAALQIHWTKRAKSDSIMNIPIYADFFGKGYSQNEYEENRKKYDSTRIVTYFTNTRKPGNTFGFDEQKNAIWFKNPSNKPGEFKKEDVGIKTRHGLTYGKYTVKIKMAELLTKGNVWTGVTNAIWMINETLDEWNRRRICSDKGFMPFYGAGKGETRVPQISYSEIDFEILKAAEIWPKLSYKDKQERKDPSSHVDKVMIACTNWDMACPQPDSFDIGLRHIQYDNQTFNIHRWDDYYNALTLKTPAKDDELFGGEYYYFQLEWKPTEIIWRVGPDKDNLRVVGYMNDKVTTIPNNQMLMIITQEFHFSKWWPKCPFNQEDIPFTSEDLKGYLYSIEIE